jgi:hypothetical protein
MKVADVVQPYKVYIARVFVKQPGYTGNMDVTVTAQNLFMAKQLMKQQYGITDAVIGTIKELKN